jgi:hypothetical protein
MDGMWVQFFLKDLMAVEVVGGMGMVGDCERIPCGCICLWRLDNC